MRNGSLTVFIVAFLSEYTVIDPTVLHFEKLPRLSVLSDKATTVFNIRINGISTNHYPPHFLSS